MLVVDEDLGEGQRRVRLEVAAEAVLLDVLSRRGQVPLPPYITTPLIDPERYQTTYAIQPGSVAAPTAGLHLTPAVLAAVEANGAQIAPVAVAHSLRVSILIILIPFALTYGGFPLEAAPYRPDAPLDYSILAPWLASVLFWARSRSASGCKTATC